MGVASRFMDSFEIQRRLRPFTVRILGSMKALGWYGTTLVLDVHLVAPSVLRARPSYMTQPGNENRGVTGWYQRMVT